MPSKCSFPRVKALLAVSPTYFCSHFTLLYFTLTKPPFFHQNPSLRKKKRKSFQADAEEEGENQGLSVPLSIYLCVCWLVGRSVCLSVCISVCLAFYLEQKVIEQACAFFNLLFVCSFFFFFANWSKSFDSLFYLSCLFTRVLIYFV